MASRRPKDNPPVETPKQIVKKEPASPLDITNRFTTLGTIPKINYSTVLASSYDPYALTPVNRPIKTVFPKSSPQYIKKQYYQHLFYVEPNRASISDPLRLAKSYFPPKFHWIPEHREKNLNYYSDLLRHERSIIINTISDHKDTSKIIYHSVYLANFISEEQWGSSLTSTRTMPSSPIPYSYYDYIMAWTRFMLHQNENMSHSWFVNFDKEFTGDLPLWFNRWWGQFGPVTELFPAPLLDAFNCFKKCYRCDAYGAKFPALLHFVKKYKIPWILKWQYEKDGDVLSRHWYVKWWGKFPHTQKIITAVASITRESSSAAALPMAKNHSFVQTPAPVDAPSSSSGKNVQNKSSSIDNLRKNPDALRALLKWAEEAVADQEDSKASSEESVAHNPYFPYDQELFGHDEDNTPDLRED